MKYNPKIGNVSDAYYVYVVFKDDKNMIYVYEQINGKIVQTGFSGPFLPLRMATQNKMKTCIVKKSR